MSYTREYSEIVTGRVRRTVHIDYPPSENGGSTSYEIDEEIDIPVDVNIHVDTNPFDYSIQHCENNVDILTASVVATEAAQIASKRQNSIKVADSIIEGFFSYIKSEISQQVAELSQQIDAHLMHVKELAKACVAMKKQMESDYNRISSRYANIFEDLNNELTNRIFQLDKPAFVFKKETDNQKIRTSDNDLVNIVTIFGVESGDLQSKVGASIAKKRALDTLFKAKSFLWQQKKLNTTIQQSMLNENATNSFYVPVCYIETNNANSQIDKNIFIDDYLTSLNNEYQKVQLTEKFSSKSIIWDNSSKDTQKNLSLYFNSELNNNASGNDKHSVRVREMIQKIADLSSINVINIQKN